MALGVNLILYYLVRQDLSEYELARCNDGTPAAYFYQQVILNIKVHDKIHFKRRVRDKGQKWV